MAYLDMTFLITQIFDFIVISLFLKLFVLDLGKQEFEKMMRNQEDKIKAIQNK